MASPGNIGVVGLDNPRSKLLGSLGKVPHLAAGHSPEGPMLRSAARYSIGGRGFKPRQGLPWGGGWSLGLAVSLTGRTSPRQAVVARAIRRRLGRTCGSPRLWSCRGIGAFTPVLVPGPWLGPSAVHWAEVRAGPGQHRSELGRCLSHWGSLRPRWSFSRWGRRVLNPGAYTIEKQKMS